MADQSRRAAKKSGRVQLPTHTAPVRYSITLEPCLQSFTYTGHEEVEVEVRQGGVTELVLHSKEISVSDVKFCSGETELEAISVSYNLKLTTLTLGFESALPEGAGVLSFNFVGINNNQMCGFYRSVAHSVTGEKKTMLSTQFESLDARRAFPCWDEPALKAVFSITLIVPVGLHAFSNMPESACEYLDHQKLGKKRISFMDTPRMSTYLVAFCVGEFDFVQQSTKHGVLVRVYTAPGHARLGRFSLQIACDTLDFYNDFFDVKYPLPKLDMVAVAEFAAGAMENWGLVTYREVDLLVDPQTASPQQRQRVCTVVTHELAHQWFGNLVTMAWWDDLWLNEGFAAWSQTFAADALFPEWNMWEQFVLGDQAAALRLDSLRTSHPIQVPIHHAEEVEQIFDAISYCKGACVVRMLQALMGVDAFRQGLRNYMRKHQYSNTETYDLWAAWEETSGLPISNIMATWTEQMGFPLVTVTDQQILAGPDGAAMKLTLHQRWFIADGSLPGPGEDKLWTINLVVNVEGAQAPTTFSFSSATAEFTVPLPKGPHSWVKLNAGQIAPLRVSYPEKMLLELRRGIHAADPALSPSDRLGIILDSFALVKAGLQDPAFCVKTLEAFAGERNATVWSGLSGVLLAFDRILQEEPAVYGHFVSMARGLVLPALQSVGWEAAPNTVDTHVNKLLRGTVVALAATFCRNDAQVVEQARRRFDAVVAAPTDSTACPSEYKVPVFQIALANGGEAELEQLFALYAQCKTDADRRHVLMSVGAVDSDRLRLKVLEWAISGAIKLQDFFYPIGAVSAWSTQGSNATWQFFQQRYHDLRTMLRTAPSGLFEAVIGSCCSRFSTAAMADQIGAFLKARLGKTSERMISQMLETIRGNAVLLAHCKNSSIWNLPFWAPS